MKKIAVSVHATDDFNVEILKDLKGLDYIHVDVMDGKFLNNKNNNLDVFKLVQISENEVIFYDENGDLRRHVFDFTQDKCSLTTLALQSLCFDDIEVLISIFSDVGINICAATYPFDMRPTENYPMNAVASEYVLDPGFDGYINFSVT